MNESRKSTYDLKLWLFVILPMCVAMAFIFRWASWAVLGMPFAFALIETGRVSERRFSVALVRYLGCAVTATAAYYLIGHTIVITNWPFGVAPLPTPSSYSDTGEVSMVFNLPPIDVRPIWARGVCRAVICFALAIPCAIRLRTLLPAACLYSVAVSPVFLGWQVNGPLLHTEYLDQGGATIAYAAPAFTALIVVLAAKLSKRPFASELSTVTSPLANGRRLLLGVTLVALLHGGIAVGPYDYDWMFARLAMHVYTHLIAAVIGAVIVSLFLYQKVTPTVCVLGVFAGVAASQASVFESTISLSATVGALAGGWAVVVAKILELLSVRDELGAISGFSVGAVVGVLAMGIAHPAGDPSRQAFGIALAITLTWGVFLPLTVLCVVGRRWMFYDFEKDLLVIEDHCDIEKDAT